MEHKRDCMDEICYRFDYLNATPATFNKHDEKKSEWDNFTVEDKLSSNIIFNEILIIFL